jgi:microbial collagenase
VEADPQSRIDHVAALPRRSATLPAPAGTAASDVPLARHATQTLPADCTLDHLAGLSPAGLAGFLTEPGVTADECLSTLLWTWTPQLAHVFTPADVETVAARTVQLAPGYDGTDSGHLHELWYYLHAANYQGFYHPELGLTGQPDVVAAYDRAVDAYTANPHWADLTDDAGRTGHEMMIALNQAGVRAHHLPLLTAILGEMATSGPRAADSGRQTVADDVFQVNYLGVSNADPDYLKALESTPAFVAALGSFGDDKALHPKADWLLRDGVDEYGRLGTLPAFKDQVHTRLAAYLPTAQTAYGPLSYPWLAAAQTLEDTYHDCARFHACRSDVTARVFTHTYTYDDGNLDMHTPLGRATMEELYYASKQVKSQFFRILGTDQPLAGDPNKVLHMRVYASRADYEKFQPYLYRLSTANGGITIESMGTFFTYQRRVPQDSTLTLEELFRHEYTHYLNGRWAVPGIFGDGSAFFLDDRTTAFDEGMAEYLAGSTQDGVRQRKALIDAIIADQAVNGRMTVQQAFHAGYGDADPFRFYAYTGSLFAMLGQSHPALLHEMYGYLRKDDTAGWDAFRNRLGADAALQAEYNGYLDTQIADEPHLFVPTTPHTPPAALPAVSASAVHAAFVKATGVAASCTQIFTTAPRFACTGRITASLPSPQADADQQRLAMAETADYYLQHRAEAAHLANFADMNCYYGDPQPWSGATAETSRFTCEGPLRTTTH